MDEFMDSFMDSWTPEQRREFLIDWQNDEYLLEASQLSDGQLCLQLGCGQKRSLDDVNEGANTPDEPLCKDERANEAKKQTRKVLVAMAKKRGITYAGNMNKEQLRRVISLNKQDPTILCLPEVENKRNIYRENHREEACETSWRWRRNNPKKSAAHWARRKDLTKTGLLNWGVKKCDRIPGECWKTLISKPH